MVKSKYKLFTKKASSDQQKTRTSEVYKYKVTGKTPNGRSFKPIYTNNAQYASGINLYSGTKWESVNGKWKKAVTV